VESPWPGEHLTVAIWLDRAIAQPITRSLIGNDH